MPADATVLDPRTTLARPDLAALALEGIVRADVYRPTRAMVCAVPVGDLFATPDAGAERIDQLIHGEVFDVLDEADGQAWGQARRDGLVGWVRSDALTPQGPRPTRRMASTRHALPLNALIDAEGTDEALVPIGDFETTDLVAVAERLLGTPHRLGARSSLETDCSGLVQQALYACGQAGPRHADQQAELGRAVTLQEAARGDLVVWLHAPGDHAWTGHVALFVDADQVIHATGHHGRVVIEPFAEADARYRANGFAAPILRRL